MEFLVGHLVQASIKHLYSSTVLFLSERPLIFSYLFSAVDFVNTIIPPETESEERVSTDVHAERIHRAATFRHSG